MDEEEQKRQAASAAFAQAAAEGHNEPRPTPNLSPEYEDPNVAVQMNRQRGAANGRMPEAERIASQEDTFGATLPNRRDADAVANNYPEVQAAAWQQTGQLFGNMPSVPGASDAFKLLDTPTPGPLEYDPATAAGLPQETQDAFQRNWDDNLAAARNAIEGNGPGKEERDALAIYTDQLVRMADDYQNQRRAEQAQQQVNADPYAAQRQREAAVGKRMAEYDVFSSPTATTTLFTPDTARTNTYDRIMRDKSGKEVFDYFM